jgi:hypothetical protein
MGTGRADDAWGNNASVGDGATGDILIRAILPQMAREFDARRAYHSRGLATRFSYLTGVPAWSPARFGRF